MSIDELPDAELDVIGCLWEHGAMTARQIRESLEKRRPMAHATVCTLLRRLEDKNCVSREKSGVGKSFQYKAIVKRSGPAKRMLGRLLDRAFAGDGVALVASLLETRPPSASEIDELEDLLAELKKKKRKRSKKSS